MRLLNALFGSKNEPIERDEVIDIVRELMKELEPSEIPTDPAVIDDPSLPPSDPAVESIPDPVIRYSNLDDAIEHLPLSPLGTEDRVKELLRIRNLTRAWYREARDSLG